MKPKTKAAKATTKKASAKKAKFAPITIEANYQSTALGDVAINRLPMVTLKELLRNRCIPIPKDRVEMVGRLSAYLESNDASIRVTITH